MENSTNALIISGLILISIIICSIFVTIFSISGNFAKNIEGGTKDIAVQKYNAQFEKYFKNVDNQIKISGPDIVSLVNLAISINNKEPLAVRQNPVINILPSYITFDRNKNEWKWSNEGQINTFILERDIDIKHKVTKIDTYEDNKIKTITII